MNHNFTELCELISDSEILSVMAPCGPKWKIKASPWWRYWQICRWILDVGFELNRPHHTEIKPAGQSWGPDTRRGDKPSIICWCSLLALKRFWSWTKSLGKNRNGVARQRRPNSRWSRWQINRASKRRVQRRDVIGPVSRFVWSQWRTGRKEGGGRPPLGSREAPHTACCGSSGRWSQGQIMINLRPLKLRGGIFYVLNLS